MIKLTENDLGRLKNLSYDSATVEALEKLFLGVYLEKREEDTVDSVHVLASARLAIDLLIMAFKKLDSFKKVESKKQDNENPAL